MSLNLTKDDVGKKFVTRGGRIAEIINLTWRNTYQFDVQYVDGSGPPGVYPVTKYGSVYIDGESGGDLMYRYREAIYSEPGPSAESSMACVNQDGPQNVLRTLPSTAADRKAAPILTGCVDYFPLALAEVAKISKAGNDQHNPGEPLHWARHKSTDHGDCVIRHLIERGTIDTDGVRHTAKAAWRVLALLQTELEDAAGWKPAPETE